MPTALPSAWEWVQLKGDDEIRTIELGTQLTFYADDANPATAISLECGSASGTLAAGPDGALSLELDSEGVTWCGEVNSIQLLSLLDSVSTWRFENGGLVIDAGDSGSLQFEPRE